MAALDGVRKNWPRVGAVLGMGIAGAPCLNSTYPFTVKQMGPYKVTSSTEQPS